LTLPAFRDIKTEEKNVVRGGPNDLSKNSSAVPAKGKTMNTATKTKKQCPQYYVGNSPICEGLAVACIDGKYLHVKPDGTPAYSQRYDWVGNFIKGLARALKDGQWFHIRPDGTPAYDLKYDDVGTFRWGLAWARLGNDWFHIRLDGFPAYQKRYDSVSSFRESGRSEILAYAYVRKGGEEFCIRPNGMRT
jgi:hypothetical protein